MIIVPSSDGTGTNALVRTPPDAIASCFGPGSFRAHLDQARQRGVPAKVLRPAGLLFDIDTPEDVDELLRAGARFAYRPMAANTMDIRIVGLDGLPEVRPGDDLAGLILAAAAHARETIAPETIVIVAQKIVSKAEGAIVDLREIRPSEFALQWARQWGKDARFIELILSQSRRIVRMDRGVLIAETHRGFVAANAGIRSVQRARRALRDRSPLRSRRIGPRAAEPAELWSPAHHR